MKSSILFLLLFTTMAHAQVDTSLDRDQVKLGDTKELASVLLRLSGVNFSADTINNDHKSYRADSVMRAGARYRVTAFVSADSVSKIRYETVLDSNSFLVIYGRTLGNSAAVYRFDDGIRLKTELRFPLYTLYLGYDRQSMSVTEEACRRK